MWKLACMLDVPGTPKGQPRPRAAVRGRHAMVYDPKTAAGYKDAICLAVRRAGLPAMLSGAIRVELFCSFPRPARLETSTAPSWAVPHLSKPDMDNIAKAVLDALTVAGVWADDAMVCSLLASKSYAARGQAPGTCIHIYTLEENAPRCFGPGASDLAQGTGSGPRR